MGGGEGSCRCWDWGGLGSPVWRETLEGPAVHLTSLPPPSGHSLPRPPSFRSDHTDTGFVSGRPWLLRGASCGELTSPRDRGLHSLPRISPHFLSWSRHTSLRWAGKALLSQLSAAWIETLQTTALFKKQIMRPREKPLIQGHTAYEQQSRTRNKLSQLMGGVLPNTQDVQTPPTPDLP